MVPPPGRRAAGPVVGFCLAYVEALVFVFGCLLLILGMMAAIGRLLSLTWQTSGLVDGRPVSVTNLFLQGCFSRRVV